MPLGRKQQRHEAYAFGVEDSAGRKMRLTVATSPLAIAVPTKQTSRSYCLHQCFQIAGAIVRRPSIVRVKDLDMKYLGVSI
jgi:hypothetical protein